MPRRPDLALEDIRSAIAVAEAATRSHDLASYASDEFLQRGVERTIEIVSEAVRHLPDEMLAARPDLPWRSIRAIGNILRHEYHRIDAEEMWEIVQRDLPPLRVAIEAMLANLKS
jgi:uncharacterized protein with HEPN domain